MATISWKVCDMCGEKNDNVTKMNLNFGKMIPTYSLYRYSEQEERLSGDVCDKCRRSLIEELRTRFCLEYKNYAS
jgi:hypothetical protein